LSIFEGFARSAPTSPAMHLTWSMSRQRVS
jgi:hypothetical protein